MHVQSCCFAHKPIAFFDVLLAVAVVVNGAKQWRTTAAYLNLTCSKSSLSPLEFIQKQKIANI